MTKSELAVQRFKEGYNCAQSVLSVFTEEYGVPSQQALQLAAGFGAGFGRMQETCGALSGACMVLGLHLFDTEDMSVTKEVVFEKVYQLMERFSEKHSCTCCRNLLGINLKTEEGIAAFKEANMKELKCQQYIKDTIELLENEFAE